MKNQSTFSTMPLTARFAIALFAILGMTSALYAVTTHMGFAPGRLFLLMAAATVCAKAKVKLYKTSTISLLTSVVLLAVVMEGLMAALIVAGTDGRSIEKARSASTGLQPWNDRNDSYRHVVHASVTGQRKHSESAHNGSVGDADGIIRLLPRQFDIGVLDYRAHEEDVDG